MKHILLFSCPDQPGIISRISSEIFRTGGNILQSEQCSLDGHFFLRFVYEGDDLGGFLREEFPGSVFSCRPPRVPRVVLMASRPRHCLLDLLWREREGELPIRTLAVLSNVQETEEAVRPFNVPFHFVPQSKDRTAGERAILEIIPPETDFVVLARYMRILSGQFLEDVSVPLINVHHSFLPAFPGGSPYEEAYERGVKVIGATSHFVVEELDAGPIITQHVRPVDHRMNPEDLRRAGKDQERLALAEAVRAYAEDRVIVHRNRTVVFAG